MVIRPQKLQMRKKPWLVMPDDRECPKCGQKMLCYNEPGLSIWYCAQCDLAFSTMLLRRDDLKELIRVKMGIVKKDSI